MVGLNVSCLFWCGQLDSFDRFKIFYKQLTIESFYFFIEKDKYLIFLEVLKGIYLSLVEE